MIRPPDANLASGGTGQGLFALAPITRTAPADQLQRSSVGSLVRQEKGL